ncbi:MAG: Arm DNA-binding domain-containing protein [Pseudomonadota bacterium]|uniref:Arm DNA-binding domain-containing protein n=1 Tax=Providencia manganoxydans TaxID=2923283 RepID=UPI003F22030D
MSLIKTFSACQIQTTEPKDKEYKLSNARGFYLLIKPNSARFWQMKYRFAGKEKKLSLGV